METIKDIMRRRFPSLGASQAGTTTPTTSCVGEEPTLEEWKAAHPNVNLDGIGDDWVIVNGNPCPPERAEYVRRASAKYRAELAESKEKESTWRCAEGFKPYFAIDETWFYTAIGNAFYELVGGKVMNGGKVKDRLRVIAKWLTTPEYPFLMLYGSVGNGKTTMAKAIKRGFDELRGQGVIDVRFTPIIVKAKDVSDMVIKGEPAVDAYRKVTPILIIDDMGVEPRVAKRYGNDSSPVSDILFDREERQMLTVITSNADDNDFAEIYGERIADRLRGAAIHLQFDERSYR